MLYDKKLDSIYPHLTLLVLHLTMFSHSFQQAAVELMSQPDRIVKSNSLSSIIIFLFIVEVF